MVAHGWRYPQHCLSILKVRSRFAIPISSVVALDRGNGDVDTLSTMFKVV
jgi:hypothetical protein